MRWRGFFSLLGALSSLSPGEALANGTSVGASRGSPLGGIVPLQSRQVRLVGEKLLIKLRDGATCVRVDEMGRRSSCTTKHYDVVARYTLSNPARTARLLYGVPLVAEADRAKAMASSVRILVAGKVHRCTIPAQAPPAPGSLPSAEEVARRVREENDEVSEILKWTSSWCVAPITIPKGERVRLELRYSGELFWDDWDGPGCAFFHYTRHLVYPLAPAGYWAGRPEAVDIRVELGRYGGITRVVGPKGHVQSPTTVEWHLPRPDLKKVTPLHLVLDVTWHQHERIARMNESWPGALGVGPGRHAPLLVDGKAATAFCTPGVELRLAEHPYWYTTAYLTLRNANARALEHPMSMMFPRAVTQRVERASRRRGELELHGALPGLLWGKQPELGFAIVPARGATRPRTVQLSLCDGREPGEIFTLAPPTLDGPGAERGRRIVTVVRPSGALRGQILARLDRWSRQLARAAGPCVITCQAKCKTGRKPPKGEHDERALACRLKCEEQCVHAAALAADPDRRPCFRFALDVGETRREKPARGGACLSEIVPVFGPRCE